MGCPLRSCFAGALAVRLSQPPTPMHVEREGNEGAGERKEEPRRLVERTKRPPSLDAAAAVYTLFHSAPHTQVRSRSHSCLHSCVDMRLPKTYRDNNLEDESREASLLLCLLPVLYDFGCDGLGLALEKNSTGLRAIACEDIRSVS